MTIACSVEWTSESKGGLFPTQAHLVLATSSALVLEIGVRLLQHQPPPIVKAGWSWYDPGADWRQGLHSTAVEETVKSFQRNSQVSQAMVELAVTNGGVQDPFEAILLASEILRRAEELRNVAVAIFEEQGQSGRRGTVPKLQLRRWRSRLDGACTKASGPLL